MIAELIKHLVESRKDQEEVVEQENKQTDLLEKSQRLVAEADESRLAALFRIEAILLQIADNVYNIAGKLGAQVTSLREVRLELAEQRVRSRITESQQELSSIEESRESRIETEDPDAPAHPSTWERLVGRLNKLWGVLSGILIPFLGGLYIGIRENIEETFGKFGKMASDLVVAVSTALLVFKGFREAVVGGIMKLANTGKGLFAWLGNTMKGLASGLMKSFSAMTSGFKWLGSLLQTAGKAIGKIAIPFTIIMALGEAVKQAFKAYDKEGLFGAIKAGLGGLAGGLIGWVGDLATWLAGTVLEFFGADELGAQLKSFDFTQAIVDSVVNIIDTVVAWFTGIQESVSEAFGKFMEGDIVGSALELIAAPFKAAKAGMTEFLGVDPESIQRQILLDFVPPSSFVGKYVIPDFVYRNLGIDPVSGELVGTAITNSTENSTSTSTLEQVSSFALTNLESLQTQTADMIESIASFFSDKQDNRGFTSSFEVRSDRRQTTQLATLDQLSDTMRSSSTSSTMMVDNTIERSVPRAEKLSQRLEANRVIKESTKLHQQSVSTSSPSAQPVIANQTNSRVINNVSHASYVGGLSAVGPKFGVGIM